MTGTNLAARLLKAAGPAWLLLVPMESIEIISRAKINLTLEVSDKREDGFHDIDSVVQVIDLADRLFISQAEPGIIEVSADAQGVPSGRANLVFRAFESFFEATGIAGGARCRLEKHIPAQAGLGGGSGNAAAAVLGLDQLYGTGLPRTKLAEIAANVGSDAPLFIYGGTVRMRGRGERIEVLPDAPQLDLVVVKPDVGVSTAWAYGELDKNVRPAQRQSSDEAQRAVTERDRDALIRSLWNDFDPVVSAAFEEILRAKQVLLESGARAAVLCGSGSAVFGVFDSRQQAKTAVGLVGRAFSRIFVTRTLGRQQS